MLRLLPLVLCAALVSSAAGAVDFEKEVAPILEERCLSCHDAREAKGDVRLDRRSLAEEFLAPGDVEASALVEQISGPEPKMPKKAAPLTAEQVRVLRDWVAEGAHWPEERILKENRSRDLDWWSLRPLVAAEPPTSDVHPVDAFLGARLAENKLVPVAEADAATLIRRMTFDLTGLPPTPVEVDAFLAESNTNKEAAIQDLIDRLLTSPAFGEKWARHWLDVARYGETHGYDKDQPRRQAWPYRDYVIRSFNEDKPYPRFVQEQVAGDALFPGERDGVLGLGFLSAGPWDLIAHSEVGEGKLDGRIAKHLDRDEMVSAVFNVFASTTVQCAQCHHHKFDPVKMEDYYRLHAVFAAVDRADRAYAGLTPEQERERLRVERRLEELTQERKTLAATSAEAKPDQQKRLGELDEEMQRLTAQRDALPKPELVYAASTDFLRNNAFRPTGGKLRTVHLLHRGDMKSPGEQMRAGTAPLWPGAREEFSLPADAPESAARAALAQALSARENPLLWRSMANRVWQWTFGRPLVGTPNDFGRMGLPPTHPELLDYLAARLRDDPRHSIKSLIRLLVTSRAYRRASVHDEANTRVDGDNSLLWRAHRRRLTAEELRDAMLAVSGALRLDARGGPSFQDFVIEKPEHSPHYQYVLHSPDDVASHRRSIYRFVVRSQPQPLLTTLDCADPSLSVAAREESTTALQALVQWNNRFVEAMARRFATRMESVAPDAESRVTFACRVALGREPDAAERAVLKEHLERHGTAALARVIFNLNAFIYAD